MIPDLHKTLAAAGTSAFFETAIEEKALTATLRRRESPKSLDAFLDPWTFRA